MQSDTETILDGLAFPEAPRWHQGRVWFTDQHAHRVVALSPDGCAETIAEIDDRPGGLGWLPDGTPLVVSMTSRRVLRLTEAGPELYADLSQLAPWHCNDMLVDAVGTAYVGNFGYDIDAGEPPTPTRLIRVDAGGRARQEGGPLIFPNGMAVTPDGGGMLVAETFAHRISLMTLGIDGALGTQRVWAELGAASPDGICLDADGALWIASPGTGELLRVREGGEVLQRLKPSAPPYACVLGGSDMRTLYVCSAGTHDPAKALQLGSGRIEACRVQVPGLTTSRSPGLGL